MRSIPLTPDLLPRVVSALAASSLFRGLPQPQLEKVLSHATLLELSAEDLLTEEDTDSDAFFVILSGDASVGIRDAAGVTEIARIGAHDCVGEMGVLLGQPRSATVTALGRVLALRFAGDTFRTLFERVPGFAMSLCQALAGRLHDAFRRIPIADRDPAAAPPGAELLRLLPIDLVQRHRVAPMAIEGAALTLGFVSDPTPQALEAVRRALPGMELRPVRIDAGLFERLLANAAAVPEWTATGAEPEGAAEPSATAPAKRSAKLDPLLHRVVAEGASDLHLSAGQKPAWRVHGDICALGDVPVLGETEVYDLLRPLMHERYRKQFEADHDTDFAYALGDAARFRVNLFRDGRGACAVLRQIPTKIVGFEQLGLPPVVKTLCEHPKGLVLVTGPTGSGKSTTLAAMIDHINKTRQGHIITLEDPVEFVHKSKRCLVNQREVGTHTTSFARALRAALREDPDIVLVGEMRDLETIRLAIETANTGHLVFATLHTSSAMNTVDRILGVFPPEEQPQIRATLADVLKGVIAQTLCRRIRGGRIAAYETLIASPAVANLLREGKTYQLPSVMMTSKAQGNSMLNDELARLVKDGKIDAEEAMTHAVDKGDLAKRLGREPQLSRPDT